MNYKDLYQAIEQDLFAFLQSDSVMGRRAGVLLEPGTVQGAIDGAVLKAIAAGADGKIGLGFIVWPVEDMIDDEPEVTFGALKLPLCIDIVENKILNAGPRGANYPIRAMASYCEKIVKAYSAQNLTTDIIPEQNAIVMMSKHDDENLRVAEIHLHTYESDPFAFQQVSSLFLTPSAPVSLTPGQNVYPMAVTIQADAGSTVYYTTDGSPPWAGNGAAAKWDGASQVKIPNAQFFRARAFNNAAGYIGSKCSSIYFA